MSKSIFINLVVADVVRSKKFFDALGYSFNEDFSNDSVACLVVSNSVRVMLHTPESLRRFTRKNIVNSHSSTEVLLALEMNSRKDVDELLELATKVGAKEYRDAEDHGFMYARSFEDPDGHIWEAFWMNSEAISENNKS